MKMQVVLNDSLHFSAKRRGADVCPNVPVPAPGQAKKRARIAFCGAAWYNGRIKRDEEKRMKPIFCLGDICSDLILPYGAALRLKRGERVSQDETDACFRDGGSVANTAAGLGTLGVPVLFCGACGDDAYGHELLKNLDLLGVDTSCSRYDPDVPTLLIALILDETGERTAIATHRTHASQHQILPSQLPDDLETRIGWLHCGGMMLREEPAAGTQLAAMRRCHAAGIPVSLDISARIESQNDPVFAANLKEAASYSSVILGSLHEELPLLSGSEDPDAIRTLTRGGRIVVARDGANGAVVYTETETLPCPAFSVPVVDTVGAGDTYNAGFLAALQRGKPLAEANRIANAAAAYCVMHAGGRACPAWDEIENGSLRI